jgi:signal transduction histidine kinase
MHVTLAPRQHRSPASGASSSSDLQLERLEEATPDDVSIRHAVRTPLTSIIGFAEAIREQADAESGQDEAFNLLASYAEQIETSGWKLLENLNSAFLLARPQPAPGTLSVGPLDLVGEIQAVADGLAPEAHDAGLQIDVSAPDAAVWGEANQGELRRALRLLLRNAFKGPMPNDTVSLGAWTTSDAAVLSVDAPGVADTAPSPPSSSDSHPSGNRGQELSLGLAVTRHVVHRMNGVLDVHTDAEPPPRIVVRLPRAYA